MRRPRHMRMLSIVNAVMFAALLLGALPAPHIAVAAESCTAPQPVCAWMGHIVGIKTPNMIASGTVLENGYIVTNRHVAEDHPRLLTRDEGGGITAAVPQPHSVQVDLVLLRPDGAKSAPTLPPLQRGDKTPQQLYVVAFDQGRNGPRVYQPGSWAMYPAEGASTQARIHTNARALPGNSGGAVVDQSGALVGILASGDGRISEVVPATHIASVAAGMSAHHADSFNRTGMAIRHCADALYDAAAVSRDPSAEMVEVIEQSCAASGNKQLFDQAGQTFGRWWMFDLSRRFLEQSLTLDPDSPNSLMSMAVTLHLDRDMAAELPILKRYIAIDPSNPQALRMAVQVAGNLGDRAFADEILELMRQHNPAALPLAESFLEQAFGG